MSANSNQFTMAWIPPILAYCTASILMTLTNKLVLSGFEYKVPFLMLAVQSLASVMLLQFFTALGWAKHRPLNRPDATRWFPVALLMAVMLYTGSKSLQYLSVPVFTIFKNLSIILVAYAETRVFGGHVTGLMLLSFALMVLSSVIAADADLSTGDANRKKESVLGYIWMFANSISSAAFVIFMRVVIRKTAAQGQFRDFDSVYYNNILTFPLFLLLSVMGGDGNLGQFITFYGVHEAERNRFVGALLFSGIAAFWISYASSWCMRVTNSTTYSMVGSLNKLPIAVTALIVFPDTPITAKSLGSIALGFASGVLYTIAKLSYDKEQKMMMAGGSADESKTGKLLPTTTRDIEKPSAANSTANTQKGAGEAAGFLNKYDPAKGFRHGPPFQGSSSSMSSPSKAKD